MNYLIMATLFFMLLGTPFLIVVWRENREAKRTGSQPDRNRHIRYLVQGLWLLISTPVVLLLRFFLPVPSEVMMVLWYLYFIATGGLLAGCFLPEIGISFPPGRWDIKLLQMTFPILGIGFLSRGLMDLFILMFYPTISDSQKSVWTDVSLYLVALVYVALVFLLRQRAKRKRNASTSSS